MGRLGTKHMDRKGGFHPVAPVMVAVAAAAAAAVDRRHHALPRPLSNVAHAAFEQSFVVAAANLDHELGKVQGANHLI